MLCGQDIHLLRTGAAGLSPAMRREDARHYRAITGPSGRSLQTAPGAVQPASAGSRGLDRAATPAPGPGRLGASPAVRYRRVGRRGATPRGQAVLAGLRLGATSHE